MKRLIKRIRHWLYVIFCTHYEIVYSPNELFKYYAWRKTGLLNISQNECLKNSNDAIECELAIAEDIQERAVNRKKRVVRILDMLGNIRRPIDF